MQAKEQERNDTLTHFFSTATLEGAFVYEVKGETFSQVTIKHDLN